MRTKNILIAKEQWSVIENVATEEQTDAWKKIDQKALSTISLLVHDTELIYLEDCETAAAAWDRLGEIYEAKGIMRRILLRRSLLLVQYEDNGSIQEYINEVTKITRQLKGIGTPVSDEDMALTLLIGLPDSFNHLITSLEVQEKNLTTDYSDHQNCFNVLKKLLTCHLLTMACIIYYGVLIKVIKRLFLSIGRENHVCKNFICKVIYVNTCDGH
jgi:hypothetical protein